MTNIDIFSGFLGAGKTTLIKKLIKEAYNGEKLVLIENEFGEIGIDGGFMKDAGINVKEMNSGCICCSLVGDFGEALQQVIDTYKPDRILIEPSGVGKLSDVIKAVMSVDEENDNVRLNSFAVVVDAKKCKVYMKNFGEFFNDQIENAGCILLSHTDGMTDNEIDKCVNLIRAHNGSAAVVTTPWDNLPGDRLRGAIERKASLSETLKKLYDEVKGVCPDCGHHHHHSEECHGHDECECHHEHHEHHHEHDHDHDCGCGCHHDHHDHECECHHEHHHDHECECHHEHHHDHHHGHHHADDVFASWGIETVKTYSQEDIERILSEISDEEKYGMVIRAKGIVRDNNEGWIHFDYIPGEADVRSGCADVSGKICVIGSGINRENIETLFKEC